MKSQLAKNKELLLEEIEKIGSQKLKPEFVARLGVYRNAYKALNMLCEEDPDYLEKQDSPASHEQEHHNSGYSRHPFTQETAQAWMGRLKNDDGTTGPHWPMEHTEQARKQRNIDCDPLAFYVTMNMIYSDYCKAAEKAGANSMDFYAYMSKAFLDDKDAQPDKLERYYQYIVKK